MEQVRRVLWESDVLVFQPSNVKAGPQLTLGCYVCIGIPIGFSFTSLRQIQVIYISLSSPGKNYV